MAKCREHKIRVVTLLTRLFPHHHDVNTGVYFGVVFFLVFGLKFSRKGRRWRLPIATFGGALVRAIGLILLGSSGVDIVSAGLSLAVPVGVALTLTLLALLTVQRPPKSPPV